MQSPSDFPSAAAEPKGDIALDKAGFEQEFTERSNGRDLFLNRFIGEAASFKPAAVDDDERATELGGLFPLSL
jgi:hypothetical protein